MNHKGLSYWKMKKQRCTCSVLFRPQRPSAVQARGIKENPFSWLQFTTWIDCARSACSAARVTVGPRKVWGADGTDYRKQIFLQFQWIADFICNLKTRCFYRRQALSAHTLQSSIQELTYWSYRQPYTIICSYVYFWGKDYRMWLFSSRSRIF